MQLSMKYKNDMSPCWKSAARYCFCLVLLIVTGCNPLPSELKNQILGVKEVKPIRIGILHSQTGTMAVSETSLRHAEILAVEEINASGGVLGRPLEAIVKDGRSRADLFAKRAKDLLNDDVEVIFGCWRSNDRKAILPILDEADALLFYPLQYEGNECSRSVFYSGQTPNQQILPALDWFMSEVGGRRSRVFLIGSDYIFARTVSYIVKKYLESSPMQVVGEVYVPFGHTDFGDILMEIQKAQPDLILNMLNGDSNIPFYVQVSGQGIDPKDLPILATSISEAELRSIPPKATQGHFAAWSYFQSLDTEASKKFLNSFANAYGDDRVVNDPMEAAYTQVYLWKEAVERAGTTDSEAIRKVLEKGIELDAPSGRVRIDPRNHHLYKKFRLGKIRPDQQFEIVFESPEWIRPEPFPAFAFPDWSCDWTRGGLRKGNPVPIDK
jgi:urea transport system substrate-binding protein